MPAHSAERRTMPSTGLPNLAGHLSQRHVGRSDCFFGRIILDSEYPDTISLYSEAKVRMIL